MKIITKITQTDNAYMIPKILDNAYVKNGGPSLDCRNIKILKWWTKPGLQKCEELFFITSYQVAFVVTVGYLTFPL